MPEWLKNRALIWLNFRPLPPIVLIRKVLIYFIYQGYLKDCIYEIPDLNTMLIAKQNGTVLNIIGVFSLRDIRFSDLAKYILGCTPFKLEG